MPSFVILFTVAITVIVSYNEVNGASVQELDSLIDLLKRQRRESDEDSDSDSTSASDTSDYDDTVTRAGKPDAQSIGDVLEYVGRVLKNKKNRSNKRTHKEKPSSSYRNSQRLDGLENTFRNLFADSIHHLPQSRNPLPKPVKKHLTPNRLIFNGRTRNGDELEDYSKIYVVLSPKAMQKTKTRASLNQLISKILSLSSSSANQYRQAPVVQKRYKGFAVSHTGGRRRGSREKYAPNDSEDDKPSKRGRNGGPGAGHTAIPYIRHRGENIYEKDN